MPRLENFDLYIFDLDGTLIDSRIDIMNSVNAALSSVGLHPCHLDEVARYIGRGTKRLLMQAIAKQQADFEAAFKVFSQHYGENLLVHTRLYDGAQEVINQLNGKKKAVISNKRQRFCDPIIDGLNLREHFDVVLGGNALEKSKPHPMPLLHVASKLNISPERSVMVGDSPVDVEAGKAAGMFTIGLTDGFTVPEEIEASKPDLLISTVADLRTRL